MLLHTDPFSTLNQLWLLNADVRIGSLHVDSSNSGQNDIKVDCQPGAWYWNMGKRIFNANIGFLQSIALKVLYMECRGLLDSSSAK